MDNPLSLISGKKYKVTKPFTNYDRRVHASGEEWVFIRTNFLPYDDGLTLHVRYDNVPKEIVYRLQWRQDEQAYIIEHFSEFVQLVE